jgi:hypothetical protein
MSHPGKLLAVLTMFGLSSSLIWADATSRNPAPLDQHVVGESREQLATVRTVGKEVLGPTLKERRNLNPSSAIPLSSLKATTARPIFSPSRRPIAKPNLSQPTPTVNHDIARPALALVGAVAGEDEDIAVFLDQRAKRLIRLKTGESHAGWTLEAVAGREVTLIKSGRRAVFTLLNSSPK